MKKSAEDMLRSVRSQISALALSGVGPGDIHPGILTNIDEAIHALNTGRDRTGQPVSTERVASGLQRLIQYVSTPDWTAMASATVQEDSLRISMLQTYLFDLGQIANIIASSPDSSTPQTAATDGQPEGEITFSCPSCSQHIACDVSYRGEQVQCPTCNAEIVVPNSNSQSVPQEKPSTQEKEAFLHLFTSLKQVTDQFQSLRRSYGQEVVADARAAITRITEGRSLDPGQQYQMMVEQEAQMAETKRKLEELLDLDLATRKGLVALGGGYVPVYITAIESEIDNNTESDSPYMLALLAIVGQLRTAAVAAVPVLVRVLKKNHGQVSMVAATSLGTIGGQEALEALAYVRDKTRTIKERKNVFFTKEREEYEFGEDLRRAATEALR